MALVSVTRPLLPVDHQKLRAHIPEINRLGDLSIKWRRLGEAGVTLVERGKYLRAIEKQAAQLALRSTESVVEEIRSEVLPAMPGGNGRLHVPVNDVTYYGEGVFRSIAYVLDSDLLVEQRNFITAELDRRNGVNSDWGDFEPHVSVATLPEHNRSDAILDAFWNFALNNHTLMATVANET